jgi:putative protease
MNKPELLSPVGDFDCLIAAVQNGADSVYFGSSFFNARASATNFDLENIQKAIDYAKLRNVKTHLTLNTLIKNDEFEQAILIANKVYEYGIDAIIVQDLGLAKFLIKTFPDLPVHASTQMSIHNLNGALELEKMGFKRIVLARELSIDEIKDICKKTNIEIETFIHGALCISYSGQCLFSSMIGGRSGNRGKCAQACRLPYELLENTKSLDKGYLLSPRDMCALEYLPELISSGVNCY